MLGWNYASVVHTQTEYGTTAVFVSVDGAGLELCICGAYSTKAVFVGAAGAGLELRLSGAHTDRLRHHRLRRFRQEKKHSFSTLKEFFVY